MPVEPIIPSRPDSEPKIEVWTSDVLKRYLERSCIEDLPGVYDLEHLPRVIELGSYARKALACLKMTKEDPRHRERGAAIQWEPGRQIVMLARDDKLIIGTDTEVAVPRMEYTSSSLKVSELLEALSLEDYHRRRRQMVTRPIGLVHSHPVDTSFSPVDLANFLLDNNSKIWVMANSSEEIRVFISCRTTRWLEHDGTPEGIGRASNEKTIKWNEMIERRIRKIQQETRSEQPASRGSLIKSVTDNLMAHGSVNYAFGFYRGDEHGVTRVFFE